MEEMRKRLLALIIEKSLSFGKFVLTSGKESSYYLDCRKVALHPEGLHCISKLFLDVIADCGKPVDAIGGLTIGADPLVAGVVALSHTEGSPIAGFLVRKEEKKHGTMNKVEGNLEEGYNVVVVDDVVTTGSSTFKAIEEVEQQGCSVSLVLSVVDRGEGGREALKNGYDYRPLFEIEEILREADEGKTGSEETEPASR